MGLLKRSDKIFVAGHRGLMGSHIIDVCKRRGFQNLLTRTREQLDLRDQAAVEAFFASEKPDMVFLGAAKVGGIMANDLYRADFIFENLQIQNNVIWSAHKHGTHRLVFLGSSCIYPREAPQPMSEACLLTGKLEITNRPYAIAKIAGLELVHSLRLQYGHDYFSVMPTNLFGPRDNFHPENSHVLPGLMRRFHEANELSLPEVAVWGSGSPKREFMYAEDCAEACVFLAETVSKEQLDSSSVGLEKWSHVNIGSGEEVTIAELARLVASTVGYQGRIRFDLSKPDGTPRKLLDTSLLRRFGWQPRHTFHERLKETYAWYKRSLEK